jgi:hypothetical protein
MRVREASQNPNDINVSGAALCQFCAVEDFVRFDGVWIKVVPHLFTRIQSPRSKKAFRPWPTLAYSSTAFRP